MGREPIIIEMTGIFGAGYLPGLFNPLKSLLQENFFWFDEGRPRKLVTNYHIDNEAARRFNPAKRNRINNLIRKVPNLNDEEWREVSSALEWSDNLFEKTIKRSSCNIVFRRGGRLQNYIVWRDTKWKEIDVYRVQPKLPIFLSASYSAIEQTFEQNKEVRRIINASPQSYCSSPERAWELQNDWFERAKNFPGLIPIERERALNEELSKEEFAKALVDKIIPITNLFGLKTMNKRKVFISYSRADEAFAEKLEGALKAEGMDVWIDKKAIMVGDSLILKIREGLDSADFVCALISKTSINSKWVKQELDVAFNQQIRNDSVKVLPLIIDDGVVEDGLELPYFLEGKLYIDFSKNNFDSCLKELMRRLKA
jgi:hypothetical protein